jgi:hypothetical protein
MTVKELKIMLDKYPDDMEVLNSRCSDYDIIQESEWHVIKAVPTNNGWVMRSHKTMKFEHKENEKEYLFLEGN